VCPGWDNSPRRKNGAFILINSSPERYERWLRDVVNLRINSIDPSQASETSANSLVFINAWNEWAEGNHLEPCQRWGHAYLEATRKALRVHANEELIYANREAVGKSALSSAISDL
jgi:hypothetical protein